MSMIINPYRFAGPIGAPAEWMTPNEGVHSAYSNNWHNYTVRTMVSRFVLPAGATKFRVTFTAAASAGMEIDKCYIGLSRLLTFDSTPEPLLFSGSAGTIVPAGGSVLSDETELSYDGTRDLCISFYIPSGASPNNSVANRAGNFFMNSQHAGGDSAINTGGTWTRSISNIRAITKFEAYTGGSWKNLFASQDSTASGYTNYTIRSLLGVGQLTSVKTYLRLGIYGRCIDMFIGNSAEGSNPFDFLATPTRLLFGGSNGTGTEDHRVYMTDDFARSILDLTKPVLMSYATNSSLISRRSAPPSGQSSKYKSGNQAGDVTWPTPSTSGDYLGPVIIDEKY